MATKNDNENEEQQREHSKFIMENHGEEQEESDLTGDYRNVAILLFLYILQGIPLGISSAVRILLQNRGVSYKEQAVFSFASYPFTSMLM